MIWTAAHGQKAEMKEVRFPHPSSQLVTLCKDLFDHHSQRCITWIPELFMKVNCYTHTVLVCAKTNYLMSVRIPTEHTLSHSLSASKLCFSSHTSPLLSWWLACNLPGIIVWPMRLNWCWCFISKGLCVWDRVRDRYDLVKYEASQGRALSVWLPETTKESTDLELSKSKNKYWQKTWVSERRQDERF